jgi:hypothetical protein
MISLQKLQFPIDRAIFADLLPCLPRHWTKAKLIASQRSGGTSLNIRIDSLGQSGAVVASDDLQAKVRELFVLNNQFNSHLNSIEYHYELRPDGKWSFAGDYKYGG